MNINPNRNNLNFGWSCHTHKVIMDTAIQDMPQFAKYKEKLEHFVQQPDYDDIGFLANKHFYFGDKTEDIFTHQEDLKEEAEQKTPTMMDRLKSLGSFGLGAFNTANILKKVTNNSNSASFMDFNGKNNAKAAYYDHLDKIDMAIEDEDDEATIENAARACHFLQDITQPQHIQETSAFGKAIDLKIHTDYEKFADNDAENCAKYFTPEIRNPRSCVQLFNDNFQETKDVGKITRKNEPYWDEITQQQFNLAVQSTKEFLQNVSDQMGLEYRDMSHHDHD